MSDTTKTNMTRERIEQMTEELLPCPFCGTEPKRPFTLRGPGDEIIWRVLCPCGAIGPNGTSKEGVTSLWNYRVAPQHPNTQPGGGERMSDFIERLQIEVKDYPNPEYQYGIFRVDGVEIGRPEKVEGGWTLRGGRKARTALKVAELLLIQKLGQAMERQAEAAKQIDFAFELLRQIKQSTTHKPR